MPNLSSYLAFDMKHHAICRHQSVVINKVSACTFSQKSRFIIDCVDNMGVDNDRRYEGQKNKLLREVDQKLHSDTQEEE